jgi:hypothetical protein
MLCCGTFVSHYVFLPYPNINLEVFDDEKYFGEAERLSEFIKFASYQVF